jgi:HEAT repeat protein
VGKLEQLKAEMAEFLEAEDYAGLAALARVKRPVLSTLISMSYAKATLLAWRAMDAIGRLTAEMPADHVRNRVQRVLWMMRDESGTNSWAGPEILTEIVARNPEPVKDIAPIIVTNHDELLMRAGSLRAIWRIGAKRPGLVVEFAPLAAGYLRDPDPEVRGHAALALGAVGGAEHLPALGALASDTGAFLYYDGSALLELPVAEAARRATEAIRKRGREGAKFVH